MPNSLPFTESAGGLHNPFRIAGNACDVDPG